MLFYPDQFFYNKGPQREGGRSRHRRHGGQHYGNRDASDNDERVPHWFGQHGEGPHFQRRQPVPDEYIVLDEDELNALRAFRAAKRRSAQREEYERAQLARQKAEAERRAQEAARREAEARMQAQIEANARAAAREYLRRQQARQQAILEAQQAERQRQQQFVMEQLRRQFGLFAVPTQQPREEADNEGEETRGDIDDARETDFIRDAVEEAQQQQIEQAAQRPERSADNESQPSPQKPVEEEPYDPIRSLIEALAPYPFILTTESSDEEDGRIRQEEQDASEDDSVKDEREAARSVEFVVEPDTAFGGPTCETASEDSEPVYIEEPDFRVMSATPPVPVEFDSADDASSLKDRRKERQASAPIDHLKKAKTKEARKEARKEAKRERKQRKQSQESEFAGPQQASRRASTAEISGLLSALSDELKRLKDAYTRLSNAKPTNDLRDVISRLEAVKIGYGRTEEIYNKLDEVRAGKDERKLKHEITTESVALADKYEELLSRVYEEKREVSAKNSRSATPSEEKTTEPSPGNVPSPKHEVVLEEVQDESD